MDELEFPVVPTLLIAAFFVAVAREMQFSRATTIELVIVAVMTFVESFLSALNTHEASLHARYD